MRKFRTKTCRFDLASMIADEIVKVDEYDPVDDPGCWGKPRETFGGDDEAFLKSAEHAIYSGIANLTPRVADDLKKVDFDTENVGWQPDEAFCEADSICGFHTLPNGLSYFGVTAGGDWECPIFFIIYHDGKELRGYIPKDGNTWNHKRSAAFGNASDDELEDKEFKAQFGVTNGWQDTGEADVDCTKIQADIQARIQFSG